MISHCSVWYFALPFLYLPHTHDKASIKDLHIIHTKCRVAKEHKWQAISLTAHHKFIKTASNLIKTIIFVIIVENSSG